MRTEAEIRKALDALEWLREDLDGDPEAEANACGMYSVAAWVLEIAPANNLPSAVDMMMDGVNRLRAAENN